MNKNKTPDVWNNFYEKIKEIKIANNNESFANEIADVMNPDKIFQKALEEITNKNIFTAEENKGKCVDIHHIFLEYRNFKKVQFY